MIWEKAENARFNKQYICNFDKLKTIESFSYMLLGKLQANTETLAFIQHYNHPQPHHEKQNNAQNDLLVMLCTYYR